MDKLFNTGSGFGNGQILQQGPQLHDKGNFSCGKIFADYHRGYQRQRYQHIGFDVKGGDESCDSL